MLNEKIQTSSAKISIITVVYNGEKYLEETVKSILNQTYQNIEYIIIDGASNDGTVDIIKKYEDKISYWVSEKDNGIYDAMNKGIALCNGEIIGIVNADDYLYIDSIEKVVKIFEDNKIDYTYGQVDLITEEGDFIDTAISLGIESYKYKVFSHMPFLHPTMLIKKQVYHEIGTYNTKYTVSADYDFALKLLNTSFKGKRLDFSTGVFRMGGASGGVKSYLENHQLLLEHNVNFISVYFNTFILLTKLYIRKLFNKE